MGACNPPNAYKALRTEPDMGLTLPCNMIIYEKDGKTTVSAVKPTVAMQMIDNNNLKDIAIEIETQLKKVINNVLHKNNIK